MSLLRENLFLVCTVAVLVIASAVLLAVANSLGKEGDQHAQVRVKLNDNMRGLARRGINPDVVDAASERVRQMQQAQRTVAEEFLARNVRQYKVMSFRDAEGGSQKPIPAFPIAPQLYQTKGLRLLFPAQYRQDVLELLASMQPTVAPTGDEIKEEADNLSAKAGAVRPGARRPVPAPDAPVPPRSRYSPSTGTETPPGETQPDQPEELSFLEKARRGLVYARARAGWIYADEQSMHMALASARVNYTDDLLWLAQVSLWVQRDIVAAINKTNQEAQQRYSAGKDKGVPTSAVKRLVRTNVRGYVMRPATRAPWRASAQTRKGRAAPVVGPPKYLSQAEDAGGMPPGLTQRASNKLYDVVHYEFVVIVPATHLLRLYKNLMLQNYHTILGVEITSPGALPRDRGTVAKEADETYDYGTQAVVQATIQGELLLLTDWTRGRWHADTKTWDETYRPLMPLQFLQQVAAIDATAMREEDDLRVPAAGGARAVGYR